MRRIGRRLREVKSLRAFGFEVMVVVVGVLIALSAQELVDDWNWSRKVDRGEELLRSEGNYLSLVLAEQIVVNPCVIAQIDSLEARLREPGPWAGMPAVGGQRNPTVIRAPSRPMGDAAWQALLNDGTATHLDPERQLRTSGFHVQRAGLADYMQKSETQRASLNFLSAPGQLDPATRNAALRTLGELRHTTQLQSIVAAQMLVSLRDLGRLPGQEEFDEYLTPSPEGTQAYCRVRELPLGDWRAQVSALS